MTDREIYDALPGFEYAGKCNCSGMATKKYRRENVLVYVTSTRYKVKKDGYTIKGYDYIKNMAAYLAGQFPAFYN